MSLLNTIGDILATKVSTVSETGYLKRLHLCEFCPSSSKTGGLVSCLNCGCIMNVKARFSASKCPEDRWPKIESAP